MLQKQGELWVVVEVKSGTPTAVEAFADRKSAMARESYLRQQMHPENDETGIFEIVV